jgi:hypothetical protein
MFVDVANTLMLYAVVASSVAQAGIHAVDQQVLVRRTAAHTLMVYVAAIQISVAPRGESIELIYRSLMPKGDFKDIIVTSLGVIRPSTAALMVGHASRRVFQSPLCMLD